MNGIALGKPILLGKPTGRQAGVSIHAVDLLWSAFAATLIPVGLIWDFSWESTIGIDRFWSPPHLTVNVGVWLSGMLGAWLIFKFTFFRDEKKKSGVNIGPLCAPSGAWVLLWGALVMQAALLLDNWWQRTYGLGAGLWPPPQILKAFSFITILFGGMMLCAATSSGGAKQTQVASALLIWQAGLLLAMCAVILTAENYPNWQHGAWFYKISCAVYPGVLLMAQCAAQRRWSGTQTAFTYMLLVSAMVWLLPMFPARPLTAPIHNPTDHLIPPAFPLLLVLPALVIDWTRRLSGGLRREEDSEQLQPSTASPRRLRFVIHAIVSGIAFVIIFIPVQWFFAKFLLSADADNCFFAGGGKHWPFFLKIDQSRVMFWNVKQDPLTLRASLLVAGFAVASAWIGIRIGSWLNKLRR